MEEEIKHTRDSSSKSRNRSRFTLTNLLSPSEGKEAAKLGKKLCVKPETIAARNCLQYVGYRAKVGVSGKT